MSVTEIKSAIEQLSPRDLDELVRWIDDHHWRKWDREIEADLEAGRLDAILAEVNEEYQAGKATPL